MYAASRVQRISWLIADSFTSKAISVLEYSQDSLFSRSAYTLNEKRQKHEVLKKSRFSSQLRNIASTAAHHSEPLPFFFD